MSTTVQALVTPISTTAQALINTLPTWEVTVTPTTEIVLKTSPEANPVEIFNKLVDNITCVLGTASSLPKLIVNKLVFGVILALPVIEYIPIVVFNCCPITSTSIEGTITSSPPCSTSNPPILPQEPYPHVVTPQGKLPGEVTSIETSIIWSTEPTVVFNKLVFKYYKFEIYI